MRDPEGRIRFLPLETERELYRPIADDHFLCSTTAQSCVEKDWLIPFKIEGQLVRSPRVPFVSYPFEWCDAQLADAAKLTLNISEDALAAGYELKDASAWNVIFKGCVPYFCDHLSFQKIVKPQWWAFAQFVRHFILPLALSKYRNFQAADAFKISRDGISPELAAGILGARRWITRCWPLMLKPRAALAKVSEGDGKIENESFHGAIYKLCKWYINGVAPKSQKVSPWLKYTETRAHYTDDASSFKKELVSKWLAHHKPQWVIDLGCNTGEFSKLAASYGAQVIAIDLDHESIQNLYLSCGNQPIYPIISNLDDLCGGKGWGGREFPGLIDRLAEQGDLLLMLALIHHLAISAAIPFEEISRLAATLTKRYLVVELLTERDPLVEKLAAQRNRERNEFSLDSQLEAFSMFFNELERIEIPQTERCLVLYEKCGMRNS